MKSSTIKAIAEGSEEVTFLRQIEIPKSIYGDAGEILAQNNEANGRFKRLDKVPMQRFLVTLIDYGCKYFRAEIMIPEGKGKELMKDEKWVKLRAAATSAVKELKAYEKSILK